MTLDEKDLGARDTGVALERVELKHSLLAYCDIVMVASCKCSVPYSRKYLRHEHDSGGEEAGAEEEGKGGDEDRQEVVAPPLHVVPPIGSAHHRRGVGSGAKTRRRLCNFIDLAAALGWVRTASADGHL